MMNTIVHLCLFLSSFQDQGSQAANIFQKRKDFMTAVVQRFYWVWVKTVVYTLVRMHFMFQGFQQKNYVYPVRSIKQQNSFGAEGMN